MLTNVANAFVNSAEFINVYGKNISNSQFITELHSNALHSSIVLADLPGNYLAWFAREGFPEGELDEDFVARAFDSVVRARSSA